MRARLLASALVGLMATMPAQANAAIQMLPPTPLGSTKNCPSGMQQVLSYSGTPGDGPQGGINCVPVVTDAEGDLAASGYVQTGNSSATCSPSLAGALRFNPATSSFEGCNGTNWQAFGGIVPTYMTATNAFWAYCPPGQHAVSGGASCDISLGGYATELRYSMPVFGQGQMYPAAGAPSQAIGWFAGCGYWQGSWTAASEVWVACL